MYRIVWIWSCAILSTTTFYLTVHAQIDDLSIVETRVEPEAATDFYGDPIPWHAHARLGTSRIAHPKIQNLMVLEPGETLLTCDGRSIRIWDIEDGRMLSEYTTNLGRIEDIQRLGAGNHLIMLIQYRTDRDSPLIEALASLDLEDFEFRIEQKWERYVRNGFDGFCVAHEGRWICLYDRSGHIRIIDRDTDSVHFDQNIEMVIDDFFVDSNSGECFVIAESHVWRFKGIEMHHELQQVVHAGLNARIVEVAGEIYVTNCPIEGSLAIRGVREGSETREIEPPRDSQFYEVLGAYAQAPIIVASLVEDPMGASRRWLAAVNLDTGTISRLDFGENQVSDDHVTFEGSDRRERFLIGTFDSRRRVVLMSIQDGIQVFTYETCPPRRTRDIVFSANEQRVFVLSHERLTEYDRESGRELGQFELGLRVGRMVASPDGSTLCISSYDGSMALWDTDSRSIVRVLREHAPGGEAPKMRFLDGTPELISYSGADHQLIRWDLSTGSFAKLATWQPRQRPGTTDVADDTHLGYELSKNGRLICGHANRHVEVADTSTGETLEQYVGMYYSTHVMSEPKPLVAFHDWIRNQDDELVRRVIIEYVNSDLPRVVMPFDEIDIDKTTIKIAIHPSQHWLVATVCNPQKSFMYVWDIEECELVSKIVRPNLNFVRTLRFSDSGKYLAGLTIDETVLVWDFDEFLRERQSCEVFKD